MTTDEEQTLRHETGFQRDVLTALAGLDEPYGLAIRDALAAHYDTGLHAGRIYNNLDTLVERGLVEKWTVDKRSNAYALTEKGREVVQADLDWRVEMIEE